MIDHSEMKLGRKAVKRDSRTLKLANYVDDQLQPPPPACDWTKGIQQWGMMLNDQLGDCTIAGCAHAVQVWTANIGHMVTIPDAVILQAYEQWDGYDPRDPDTDQGGIELDVLAKWRRQKLGGHQLRAFADPNHHDLDMVRRTINWFGGVYIGVSLPISAQRQDVWDVAPVLTPDSIPGSWGGHCVYVCAYDQAGFTCITWGGLKRMTVAFWNAYCDESHALLGADWIGAKGSPQGINFETLLADLGKIK